MYFIKVYRIKDIKIVNRLKTWTLEYVGDLPYSFMEKPVNVCNKLNEMFEGSCEHVIDIR